MAQLLDSILNVIKVFQKYAQEDGDCTLLCKQELKRLLLAEFGSVLRVRHAGSRPESRSRECDTRNRARWHTLHSVKLHPVTKRISGRSL